MAQKLTFVPETQVQVGDEHLAAQWCG